MVRLDHKLRQIWKDCKIVQLKFINIYCLLSSTSDLLIHYSRFENGQRKNWDGHNLAQLSSFVIFVLDINGPRNFLG